MLSSSFVRFSGVGVFDLGLLAGFLDGMVLEGEELVVFSDVAPNPLFSSLKKEEKKLENDNEI
jgi:hypothetical protein